MAVAIVDPKRNLARVVLGRRAEPPTLLRALSKQLAGELRDLAPEALRHTIEIDLKDAHVDPSDQTMHRAIVERAVRDLVA
jgi:hypothetical protein